MLTDRKARQVEAREETLAASFDAPDGDEFDTAYMRMQLALGKQLGAAGHAWQNRPSTYLPT